MFRMFSDIDKVLKEKKIAVEYPKGYKDWRKRFNDEFAKTKNVQKALDNIHGKAKRGGER